MLPTALLPMLLALGAPPAETKDEAETPSDTIVVTGQRETEKPDSEQEYVPLNSRIRRQRGPRAFNTVATDTGIAGGLSGGTDGGGVNFDPTGGTVPRFRELKVKQCRADNQFVSETTACVLFTAKQAIERGNAQAASEALAPLLRNSTLSSYDRFYANHYAYLLAEKQRDEPGRERALTAMLETGRMPEADRPAAIRTLAMLAARRGDSPAAIARLESLIKSVPDDAPSRARLAMLYADAGQGDKASEQMAAAISLVEQAGETAPPNWRRYLKPPQR